MDTINCRPAAIAQFRQDRGRRVLRCEGFTRLSILVRLASHKRLCREHIARLGDSVRCNFCQGESRELLRPPIQMTQLRSAVSSVPGGAHPSYAAGCYPRDNRFYGEWDAIAREREPFQQWMQQYVLASRNHAELLRRLGVAS
jgi:hypothetical protein